MTQTVDSSPSIADPFDAGPFTRLGVSQAVLPTGAASVGRKALIIAAVAWIPLAVLAAVQGYALGDAPRESLLLDLSAYGRYVVAIPLLVLAEAVCLPRLALVARHFGTAGLVTDADRSRYDELIAATRRSLHSRQADIVIVLTAYVATLVLGRSMGAVPYASTASTWAAPVVDGTRSISLAGVWRGVVSQPLLLVLLGAWLWRLALWTRFLRGMARLDLRLIPAHPDLAGGLRFVATSLPPFALLGLALGAMVAGGVADAVLYDSRSPREFLYVALVLVIVVLALCAGPLLTLAAPLRRARIRGTLEYGKLAGALGRRFEERWLERTTAVDAEALSAPDFSATTDLYSVAENVRQMRMVPLDLAGVVSIAAATLLPFTPVLLVVLPFHELLRYLGKLLL